MLSAQELSSLAWALAKVVVSDTPLMHGIAQSCQRHLLEFPPRALSITAWSFATLAFRDTPLLGAIAAEASSRL